MEKARQARRIVITNNSVQDLHQLPSTSFVN